LRTVHHGETPTLDTSFCVSIMVSMDYALTKFDSQFDNKTTKTMEFESWGNFVSLLEGLSKKPLASKRDAPLISPAVYQEGTTRANRNVKEWAHWACVDVDDYEGTIDGLLDLYDNHNICIYSTASSLPEKVKCRIVFDLDRRVSESELRQFWYALNRSLGDLGDDQTKDSSRMYYIPASYAGAHNYFHTRSGNALNVSRLIAEHPYIEKTGNTFLDSLPDEMRKQVLEHRKSKLTNTTVEWSNYHDCPFVSNRMVSEYRVITGEGWYRQLFKIMIATASNAVRAKYPISAQEIAKICKEIDQETGGWYDNRPLEREAQSAIEWAFNNTYEE
jgi:hypothetical protein